jgi:hypothetical protein
MTFYRAGKGTAAVLLFIDYSVRKLCLLLHATQNPGS